MLNYVNFLRWNTYWLSKVVSSIDSTDEHFVPRKQSQSISRHWLQRRFRWAIWSHTVLYRLWRMTSSDRIFLSLSDGIPFSIGLVSLWFFSFSWKMSVRSDQKSSDKLVFHSPISDSFERLFIWCVNNEICDACANHWCPLLWLSVLTRKPTIRSSVSASKKWN